MLLLCQPAQFLRPLFPGSLYRIADPLHADRSLDVEIVVIEDEQQLEEKVSSTQRREQERAQGFSSDSAACSQLTSPSLSLASLLSPSLPVSLRCAAAQADGPDECISVFKRRFRTSQCSRCTRVRAAQRGASVAHSPTGRAGAARACLARARPSGDSPAGPTDRLFSRR